MSSRKGAAFLHQGNAAQAEKVAVVVQDEFVHNGQPSQRSEDEHRGLSDMSDRPGTDQKEVDENEVAQVSETLSQ